MNDSLHPSYAHQNNTMWKCNKCNTWIDNCIDRDYHDNTHHPNMQNPFVASWYARGRPGLSPYD
jgi:hypothetical protein